MVNPSFPVLYAWGQYMIMLLVILLSQMILKKSQQYFLAKWVSYISDHKL